MRKVAQIMGLPISIDIPRADDVPFAAAFALLRGIDQQFSPYKKRSELSQYQTGRLTKDELSSDMKAVMGACQDLQLLTNGYFSALFAGRFDPSGYVKGWAIRCAGELLESLGYGTYMINAGGDVLARADDTHVWRIGLQHPIEPRAIMGTIAASNIAVASSGNYARGNHIINPITGQVATELLSVTVTGPDIAIADAFATAVFAMGYKGLEFIDTQKEYEALLVGQNMGVHMTRHFVDRSGVR